MQKHIARFSRACGWAPANDFGAALVAGVLLECPPAEGCKHGLFMTDTPPGDEPRDRSPTDASLYVLEKLAQAVDELATGSCRISSINFLGDRADW
jgi:hypothetical protein